MTELVVLVDNHGSPVGSAPKLATHTARTPLHLSFSTYIFSANNKILVTKRAGVKKVWPNVWTNSACGHQLPDESDESAIKRRLKFELGMSAEELTLIVPDYVYKTTPYNGIIEHEYCRIYCARASSDVSPNYLEVDDYKWLSWSEFRTLALSDPSDEWSYWCKEQIVLLEKSPIFQRFTGLAF